MARMPDNFTLWDGRSDFPPMLRSKDRVFVWFRAGRVSRPKAADVWVWRHHAGTGDILGYLKADAEPTA